MNVIGIDPGLDGALALVSDDGRVLEVFDMPTILIRDKRRVEPVAIVDWLIAVGDVGIVAVEDVGGLPGMGSTSAFTFGLGAGLLQGILTTLSRPWALVTPQVWTKAMAVSRDKGVHRQVATRLYPDSAGLFARVKDDGRADAVLIGTYAQRNLAFATRAS
jgi:crossover junction endodeoxyribonuclease RuvC